MIQIDKEIWVAIITTIIGPIVGYYVANTKAQKKEVEEKRTLGGGGSKIELKYHPIFARLDALKVSLETEFELENKGKEVIFRNILSHEIQIFRDNLYNLATETEDCIECCTAEECNKLYNSNMECLEKSIREYNTYFLDSNYTPDEQACLRLVMAKYNKWHEPRVYQTKEALELICSSKFYKECKTIQSVIFDWYIGAFVGTLIDAKMTLDEINGDLRGLVFRGLTL